MKKKTLLVTALLFLSLTAAFAAAASKASLSPRERALHVLNRMGFGPRPGDVDRVLLMGVEKYVERQLHPSSAPEPLVASKLADLETLEMSTRELIDTFQRPLIEARRQRRREAAAGGAEEGEADEQKIRRMTPPESRPQRLIGELQAQRLLRAVHSEWQLQEVLVDFWMNHFNVDARKARIHTLPYERDTVRPRLFGSFEELLMATAKSPAMLLYLDNARSVAPGTDLVALRPRRGMRRGQREVEQDLARAPLGLNENYARELLELHTLGVDGGYTQRDVTELARVLTGWTVDRRTGEFVFRAALHDRGEKLVLGQKIAGGGGIEEGERMIRLLARHPSTARHLATKVCRRFVADEPPASLVDRVAKVYLASGGDLRETVRAIVTSREFFAPEFYGAKVKSPLHLVASTLRAAGGTTDGKRPVQQVMAKLGEPLYLCQPPTGYGDRAEDWISAGALVDRMNFAADAASGRIPGTRLDLSRLRTFGLKNLSKTLLGGELSAESLKAIEGKLGESFDVQLAAGLVLGSPEFQRM